MTNLLNGNDFMKNAVWGGNKRLPTALFKIAALTLLLAALLMGINNAQAQAPEVSFPTATATVVEGGQVGVDVAFTSSPLAARIFVNIRVEGSATPDGDFRTNNSSANIAGSIITINAGRTSPSAFFILTMLDELEEVPETITLTLLPHTTNGPSYTVGTNNTYTLTITNKAPTPVASVHIGNAGTQAGDLDEARITATTKVTVALDRAPTTAVTVNLTRSGTATIDTDYTQTGLTVVGGDPTYSIVVPAGATTTFFTLATLADTETDPNETAVFTVTTGTGYTVAAGAAAATVTIMDDSDTTPPTVTFSDVPSHDGMTPFTLTITLSEPSDDFVVGDISTTINANIALSGSGTDYSLTVTPIGTGVIIISLNPDVFTDASNNGNLQASTGFIPYAAPTDTTPPTVMLSGAPTTANGSDTTFDVTATFSEAVTGFDAVADITVTNGTAAVPVAMDSSETTYTLTITPDGTDGEITITIPANVAVDGASNDNMASNEVSVTYDATPPTVELTGAPATANGSVTTFDVTATFSEPVTGFDAVADITVTNGTAAVPVAMDSSETTYTLTITPDGTDGEITINIPENVATDTAGNPNTALPEPVSVTYDGTAPTVMLTGAPATANGSTASFEVTATFSEAVTGFDAVADITVTNGTAAVPVAMDSSETIYTLTITPAGTDDIEIFIPAAAAMDATGNGNPMSNTVSVTYDDTPPVASVHIGTAGTQVGTIAEAGTTSTTVTVTLSAAAPPGEVTVLLTRSGSADIGAGNDYTAGGISGGGSAFRIIVAAGATTASFMLTAVDDSVDDDDETAVFTVTTGTGYTVAAGGAEAVTVTITDNDVPPDATSPVTGLAATPGNGQVALSWTNPSDTDLSTVIISATVTADGTVVDINGAGAGNDLSISATPGSMGSQTITGLVNGTGYTFSLVASDGTNSSTPATIASTPVVLLPEFSFPTTTATGPEGEFVNVDIAFTGGALASMVSLNVSLGGDAVAADYSTMNGSAIIGFASANPFIRIAEGRPSRVNFFIDPATDAAGSEGDETLIITLLDGEGYTVGSQNTYTLTITDVPPPPVASVHIGTAGTQTGTIAEAGTTSTTVTVALSAAAPPGEVTVLLTRSGSADIGAGNDYTAGGISGGGSAFRIIVAAGATTASFMLTAVDDSVDDDDETAVFTVTTGTGYTVAAGGAEAVTVTITDNDVPPDATSPGPVTGLAATPGNGQVALSWTNPSDTDLSTVIISATVTADGTVVDINGAGAGNDLSISATAGSMGSQTITGLVNGTGYTFSLVASDGTNSSTPATIASTPVVPLPEFSFPTTTATVAEGGGAIGFNIEFTGGVLASFIRLNIRVGGTAMAADYSIGSDVGSTTVNVFGGVTSPFRSSIIATTDALTEGDETLIITLLDGEGYTLGANTTYTLTITDPPPPPPVASVHIGTAGTQTGTIAEAGTTSTTVTVALSAAAPPGEVTVLLTRSGSADIGAGNDYTAGGISGGGSAFRIIVAAGATTASFMLTAVADTETDPAETAVFTVTTGTGYTVAAGGAAAVTVTILDDSDTTPPTVTLSGAPSEVTSLAAFEVTATFDEDVTGFDAVADITVTNGTAAVPAAMSNSKTTYTLTITPDGNGAIGITIPADAATDDATNGNAASETLTVTYTAPADNTPPTVTLTGPDPATYSNTEAFVVTATFSEAVTGFDEVADITVTGGTATVPVATNAMTYTLNITPAGTDDIEIFIPAAAAMDEADNPNTESNRVTVAYTAPADTTRPTATLSTLDVFNNLGLFALELRFSEVVTGTPSTTEIGTSAFIEVDNGTAQNITDFGGGLYLLGIQPTSISADVTVTILEGFAMDGSGNTNTASAPFTLSYIPPITATLMGPDVVNSEAFTVQVAFSEDVLGFEASDIRVTNGATAAPIPVGNSARDYTLTITPDGTGDIGIIILEDTINNSARNSNAASAELTVRYDGTRPTVTLTGPDPATYSSTEAFVVTATFSEAVTGFDAVTDITVTNGTATVPMSNSETTYTLTITPAAGTGDIEISIPADAAADAATNGNTASETLTVTYAAPTDTTPLTVTLFGPLTYGLSGFTTVVRFSEDVPGLTIGAEGYTSFTITNATATEFTRRSGSIYDLIITPVSGSTADISVTFNAGAATAGTKTNTVSNTLTVAHSTLPPVTLIGPDSLTHDGETVFTVRVDFTNDVSGFDTADDITISGGTTSAPVASGFGTYASYTLTITPDGTADITISLNSGVAEGDPPDNPTPNAASRVLTVFYAAPADTTAPTDTTPPTVMLTGAPATVNSSTASFDVTATFSEPVTGFDAVADITVTNGTAAVPVAMDSSETTYTLTITPDGTDGEITINIPADVAEDAASNGNTASNEVSVTYDGTAPTVTFSDAPASHDGTSFMVTVTLSEPADDFVVGDISISSNATGTLTGSGTDYTLTVMPTDTSSITIDIAADSFTDAATNGNTASETLTVTYDPTPPLTVVLTSDVISASNNDDTHMLTITFSEDVTGIKTGPGLDSALAVDTYFTFNNAFLSGTVTKVSGSVYSIGFLASGRGDITITFNAGVAMAGSRTNAVSNTLTVAFTDTTAPTVTLTGPDPANHDGTSEFMVTVTLSEPSTDFVVGDISISDNASGTLTGSGTDYTLTVTPTNTNSITIDIATGSFTDAATNGNTASETLTVTYAAPGDTTPPTVVLSSATTTVSGNSLFTVTATFSEDVTGFDSAADITVINGFASNANEIPLAPVSVNGSARVYTLTILPNTSGNISISIPANAAMDGAGLGNPASAALIVTYTGMDVRGPNVVLTPSPDSSIGERETRVYLRNSNAVFEVTVTFNEPVRGFGLDDVNIQGGTTSNLMGMDGDAVYTFDLTPSGTGTLRVGLPGFGTGITDLNGNALVDPLSLSVRYDVTPPTVALSAPATANASDTTFAVTAEFSEVVTGFNAADITVTNGAVTVSGSGPIYTLTITPDGNDGPITIAIAASVVTDVAGNGNTPSTNADSTTPSDPVSVTYDGTPPTVTLSGVPATVNVRDPFAVTATFSEAVTGFDAIADITVNGGTAMAPVAMGNDDTTYTLTITPANTDGTITITIPANAATDTTGNGNEASTSPESVTSDTIPPTVMLSGAPTTANASTTTFAVTATFSEAVTGFDAADITVDNGAVTVSGSGPIYTLTITPDGNDGTITIAIAADVVTDVSGNANTASTNADSTPSDPVSVTYDTTAPTVTLAGAPTTANSTATFEVTATFSENVTGLVAAEIDITNATVTLAGSGTTYTLTITPAGTDGEITITIPASVATDTASNGNMASNEVSVTYDATAPTVALTGAPPTVNSTATFEVTATFSENVTGLVAAEIDITNATVTLAGSGTTYTLTITPAGTDGEITITIPASVATDTASNGNTASSEVSVTYDATATTVALTGAPTTVNSTATFEVTATFSENVTGLVAAEIEVTNATVTLAGSDTTYTLTITPAGTDGEITITIPASVATDTTSNGNTASNTVSVTYDATAPTVELTGAPTTANASDTTFAVTATFSEAVTGFDVAADITVTGGTAIAPVAVGNSETTYTLTITPTTDGEITITIPANVAVDASSNNNMASNTVTVTYDTTPPTVFLTGNGRTINALFFTSVFLDTSSPDINRASFTLDEFVTTPENVVIMSAPGVFQPGTVYRFTHDGTASEIIITIPVGSFTDNAGNPNTEAFTFTTNYVDNTPPTVTLTGPDPATFSSTDAFVVTATFDEPVTGFDAVTDITVTNGAATVPVAVSNSETTYTLNITPAGTDDIEIFIPAAAAMDGADNPNTASETLTVTYTDTTRPTATLSTLDVFNSLNSFLLELTFSEVVTGTPSTDIGTSAFIEVVNGTAQNIVDLGTSYLLTIQPTSISADVTVTILEGFAMDGSGNTNTASAPVTLSYIPPVTATLMGPDVVNSAAFTVQVAFSEDVLGFVDTSDIGVTNGATAAPIPVSNSARDYTLTITPDGTGDIGIIILEDATSNSAGNTNAASAELTVRYDGTAPTVTLTGPDPATFSNTEAFVVTATFSEAVTGFDAVADITVTNGTAAAPTPVSNSETTYTLTITPAAGTGDIEISIPADAAADAATNGNTASETLTVTYAAPADTTRPTVTLTGPDPATYSNTEAFVVTATFSEAVTGFDAVTDITVTNGTAAAPTSVSNSETIYTLTITPAAGTGDIEISIPADAAADAATNGNTASEPLTVTYAAPADTTPPTVVLSSAITTLSSSSLFTVTATFSEDVTGFDSAADITVINGIAGDANQIPAPPVSVDGSARVYTLFIVPNTNGDVSISIPANAAMDGAGNGNPASAVFTVPFTGMDVRGPSVVLTPSPNSSIGERSRGEYLRNSNAVFEVTATFNEPVEGFGLDDILVQDVTTSNFMGMDGDTVYTFDVTPSGTSTVQLQVSTGDTGIMDLNDNALSGGISLSVGYDATPPTVALSDYPATANASTATFAVTATFSKAVPGFNAADITVTNGAVTVSGSGPIYTLTITPDGNDGEIMIAIAAGVVTDVAGNANTASTNADSTASDPVSVTYDGTPPTVTLSGVPATVNVRDPFAVTATFSEPVTGFDAIADITVTGGTAMAPVAMGNDNMTYTLTITPANTDGTITIEIPAAAATDTTGNGNEASTSPVSVTSDTTPPTVMLSGAPTTANASTTTFTVTATFDEAVTGFDAIADINVTGGTAMAPVAAGSSGTTYTLTITPGNTDGTITIEIPAAAATDTAGNANTASTNTVSVTYDGTAPTVALSDYPTTATSDTTFTVTAEFSEVVTGFNAADITVTNGAVTVSGSGPIYTLTITPAGNDGEIMIGIAAGVVTDVASNANSLGSSVSVTYDTTAPTVTLTGPNPATFSSTEAFVVTATFNEPVTGFDAIADIMVTNGATAVPVAVGSSGTTYTLTITPVETTDDIEIFIPTAAAMDEADNPNTVSNTVTVAYTDTTPPAVRLQADFDVNEASSGFTVTVTFDEPVTGFDAIADITVTNATATAPMPMGDDGTTYITTITPTDTLAPGVAVTIQISIAANVAIDATNNGNEASTTQSLTYTPPVGVTLSLPESPFISNGRDTFEVTATFTGEVDGFGVNGITIVNGTVTVTGSGAIYTLTITPTGNNNDPITIAIQEGAGELEDPEGMLPLQSMASEELQVMVLLDIIAPTVVLTAPDAATGLTAFTVTAIFDEPVTGFDAIADITVTNGTAVAPVAVGSSETDYTLTITPDGMGAITILIPADAAVDGASNGNTASATTSVTYTLEDTIAPTVLLTGAPATVNSVTTFAVTATFSEAVTGFDEAADITVTNGAATIAGSGTTYTLTITPDGTGNIGITIPAAAAVDGANNGNMASNTETVTYDTTAPTVMLSGAPDTVNNNSFEVTATFDEPVTGFDAIADITVTGGTAIAPIAVNNTTYTLTITPDGTGNIGITIPAAAAVDGANNGNMASNTETVTYDATAPTVMLSGAPDTVNNNSFEVTATFDEPVTGLAAADIAVTNGAATIAGSGSGTTYTLTITPDGNGDLSVSIPADAAVDGASNGNMASNTVTVTYDATVPTVELTGAPTTVNSTATFEVTATFDEPVTGLTAAEIAVTNGTLTLAGSGTIYTLTITPAGTDGEITITIPADVAADAASNGNTASVPVSVTYDATATTVELTGAPATVNSTATFEVTATFSESVTGFDAVADITVTNGTAIAPVAVNNSETIYTLTITPDGMGNIGITIPAAAAVDGAGNGNEVSNTVSVTYDTTRPLVTLTADITSVNNLDPFTVTATFSEAVTGFDMATDITVTHGMAAVPTPVGSSSTDYTLTITPAGTGTMTIFIPENVAMDEAGNGNTASTNAAGNTVPVSVAYDTTAPMVTLSGAPDAANSLAPFTVTATFSEAVTFVPGAGIEVTNGAATLSGSGANYTLTITPDGMGNIGITIPAAAAVDGANNPNTASNTVSVTYDTTRPLVTLTADITSVNNLDPFTVTATFSEAVTGFDMATDITVTHGMAAVPTPVGSSNTDYTLTITPAGTGTMTIFIPENVAMDEAGNGNTASTNAAGNTVPVSVAYDTTAPMVTLSGAPDAANSLAPFTVTATFSEAVTFVPGAGIEVTNGAATLSGSGANYTLTITPDGTGDLSITFPADVAMDAAGNGNEASDTVSVAYDATAPTVTLTGPDTLSNLAPFEVTATFSEDVTGLEVAEIVVTNGAVTTLSGSGANYVLTMTPTGNGDLSITIPRDVAVDAAANGNTASSTLAVVNTIVADTKAAITGFMLDRADKLARNQPGLTRFLQGTGCRGGLSANSTDISGSVAGCMSSGHTWGEISNTWSSDSTYTLATVGVHGFMRDNLIIGGQVQFDSVDDDRRNITGRGWLVGPYFVHQLTDQNMSFEGRLLTGRTDNDISPLGSYEDSFGTERSLAQLRITGRYRYPTVTLMPLLDFTYTEDTQKAYTDTLGNLIDEQGVDLTQLTFGMDFSLPVAVQTGQLDLTGGLSGTYSEVNGGQSDVEGGRGRAELGLNYSRDNGTTLGAGIFYDGISSDHESFGVNLSFDMEF